MERRQFIRSGVLMSSLAMTGALAGCTGDGSVEEMDSHAEEAMDNTNEADPYLQDAGDLVNNERWEECHTNVENMESHLTVAQQEASSGLDVAEENGHDDYATFFEELLSYISIFEEIATELSLTCDAGEAGNSDELETHWANVNSLNQDRLQQLDNVEDAMDTLLDD